MTRRSQDDIKLVPGEQFDLTLPVQRGSTIMSGKSFKAVGEL
jgi:hypothetical protein